MRKCRLSAFSSTFASYYMLSSRPGVPLVIFAANCRALVSLFLKFLFRFIFFLTLPVFFDMLVRV